MQFKDLMVGDLFNIVGNESVTAIKVSYKYDTASYKYDDGTNIYVVNGGGCTGKYRFLLPSVKVNVLKSRADNGKEKLSTEDSMREAYITYGGVPKEVVQYSKADCINTYEMQIALDIEKNFLIKKVIFNDPATIVCWFDGTKTVVKCQKGEKFDKEKGLALCFMKKVMGNQSNYNNRMKKIINNAQDGKEK